MSMERLVEMSSAPFLELGSDVDLWSNNTSCVNNCSGHGECSNGVCICEIQFEGSECRSANHSYFVGFASVFLALALVCLVQLVMCVLAEWQKMKAPSLLHACRVTTQKLLYLVVFLASSLRGAYFTSPTAFTDGWSRSLMSAYYPLLLSGSSLIVCFWAEVFHLRGFRWEKSQFISKSFLAFVSFNLITYSLLLAEVYTIHYLDTTQDFKNFYIHVFNGCYAVLLFIVLVFFLIYGVQVFIKIRGGFLLELEMSNKNTQYRQLFQSQESLIDNSQLQQSRIGLLSQTLMLSFVVVFLCSETLSEFWKAKVPLHSRNWYDVLFRLVEVGVTLWFPGVLWNCISPEQLWILNPKKIIKNLDFDIYQLNTKSGMVGQSGEDSTRLVDSSTRECFICKDPTESRICRCCYAHEDCLREWCVKGGELSCSICEVRYPVKVERGKVDWRAGCTRTYCRHLVLTVIVMVLSAITVWQVIVLSQEPVIGPLALGFFCLVLYICIKCLWQYTDMAWKKANTAGLRVSVITPGEITSLHPPTPTIQI